MRIAFLADGGSIHSERWVSYFAAAGEEVHWLSLSPFQAAPAGVVCHRLRPGGLGPLGALLSWFHTRMLLHAINPDLVHAHSLGSYGLLALAARGRRLIATAWGSDVLVQGQRWPNRWVLKAALRQADLLTCDAGHMAHAMSTLGANPANIHIIRFGVDLRRFKPALRTTGHTVISLRNHEPVYDIATLLRAARYVLGEIPETQFVIAGKGSQTETLQALAADLGERVCFPGAIANESVPDYLSKASVYVSTALSDAGIAASTAEAMACGLAVITTDFGENGQWVEDGKGGYIVPAGQPEILADRIVRLFKDTEERARMGYHNRKVIERRNDYRLEMGKMHDLYRSLLC